MGQSWACHPYIVAESDRPLAEEQGEGVVVEAEVAVRRVPIENGMLVASAEDNRSSTVVVEVAGTWSWDEIAMHQQVVEAVWLLEVAVAALVETEARVDCAVVAVFVLGDLAVVAAEVVVVGRT
jgi:hypothetical protein